MSKPKLSTKTPDQPETNALIDAHAQILALPRERRYAIVELATKSVNNDVATGEQQATLHAVHIELPTGADQVALEKLLDKAFTKRTNMRTRPDTVGDPDTPLEGLASIAGAGLDDGVSVAE